MHEKKAPFPYLVHTHVCPYIKVRDVVLQQDLNIANILLRTDEGEGDHSLCQQNKTKTQHMLVWD